MGFACLSIDAFLKNIEYLQKLKLSNNIIFDLTEFKVWIINGLLYDIELQRYKD